ncbi:MAG: prolipoprotein diacylglyceryl transferase, partial [Proteobacteria bacterium]|nr:prolipoprotein diacylglyceryl transferase [Pseudomonadota bacterium]
GGMAFYGGVLAGFVVIAYALFLWKRKGQGVRVFELTDILVPGLAITHAFGRVGCLAAGCCWGALSTGHVGVHYDAGSFPYAELYQEPAYRVELLESGHTPLLHATQLYEAGGEFLLFVILCLMAWKRFRPGMMTATWLMGYGVWRFIVEAMRGDSERGYFFAYPMETVNRLLAVEEEHATILTTSQGIAILMVLIGIGIILVQRKSFAKTEGSSPGQGLCGGADL